MLLKITIAGKVAIQPEKLMFILVVSHERNTAVFTLGPVSKLTFKGAKSQDIVTFAMHLCKARPKWCEFSKPITECCNAKPKQTQITLNTRVKITLKVASGGSRGGPSPPYIWKIVFFKKKPEFNKDD